LKSVGHIATLIVAIAAILGLSAGQLLKERRQILDELGAAQVGTTEGAAREIESRLAAMERDMRLLANLVSRNRGPSGVDVTTENRVIHSAFYALVAVVPQYRTLALYAGDGSAAVSALDPTEDPQGIAPALFQQGRALAATVASDGSSTLQGPTEVVADRFFYLLARRAGAHEVLVVSIDAPMLLQDALPAASADTRHVVFDPEGVAWIGCERSLHCRPVTGRQSQDLRPGPGAPATRWLNAETAARIGLPSSPALLASANASSVGGVWSLAIVSSAARFAERQNALLQRLIITALAAALAVVAVGVLILRQQRQAAALQERLHSAQELATLREKSDAIIENAPIGILGATADEKVVIANRFLVERMGPIETGRGWEEAFAATFEDGARHLRALLEQARLSPSGRAEQRDVALTAPGANDFDVRIVSLRHPADEVRLLALIEDRSQLRSLERQLVRAEKILTVGVLSAGLAHEIGTPISVIRGRAEHLLEMAAGTPAVEDLAVIVRHADRISSTIGQVLNFSRAQPIALAAVPPEAALEQARQLLDWKLSTKRVSLRITVAPDATPLSADADQLQQVLVNLIMNACDACAEGGNIRADVTVAPLPPEPQARPSRPARPVPTIRIDIHDDGCGIPAENLNAIFDPFFTTKKRGEGTGLGLTVAASIVRNHGGTLTVSSDPSQGTTFSVLWPAALSETPDLVKARA
jgi:two-component system sensor histidine kinase HydH